MSRTIEELRLEASVQVREARLNAYALMERAIWQAAYLALVDSRWDLDWSSEEIEQAIEHAMDGTPAHRSCGMQLNERWGLDPVPGVRTRPL